MDNFAQSEIHHGFIRGIWQRTRMFFQVVRAWYLAGGWPILWRKTQKGIWLFCVPLLLFGFIVFARNSFVAYSAARSANEFDNLPVFGLSNFHNILIIAPHPDDETLAAGGVIQQALAEGAQVKVVVVTNGDGQKFAPAVLSKRIEVRPLDYIALGERRQEESTTALEKLGLQPEDIVFLGYPDRGTSPMWLADWNTQCPYTAPYTRAEKNPYPASFLLGDNYCGSNLLSDLQSIIEGYKPDLIALPHPADQHPDHAAVSNFTRLAIAMISARDKNYVPEVWGYIVHYGMFPQPRGRYFAQVLMPPQHLMGKDNHWGRVDLNPGQVSLKYSAIEAYSSQDFLLGKFLPSFARRNELFESLPIQVLTPISFTSLPVFFRGTDKNPESDLPAMNNEGFPVKGGLLTGWQAARLNDKMWLDLQTKRDMLPDLDCTLYLKSPDGRTNKMDLIPVGSIFSSRHFFAEVDLATLGNPSVIAFAAEINQGGFLVSKAGWHILILK